MSELFDGARRQYGGKRGLALYLYFAMLARTPSSRRYRMIQWAQIQRLVFVCKGNICRSPFACGLARRYGLQADSFGLDADEGKPAAPTTIQVAREFGVNLTNHAAKGAPLRALSEQDLVIGFEPAHLTALVSPALMTSGAQVTAAALWLPTPNLYIHDPYGLSEDYFRACFYRIAASVKEMAKRLSLAHET